MQISELAYKTGKNGVGVVFQGILVLSYFPQIMLENI